MTGTVHDTSALGACCILCCTGLTSWCFIRPRSSTSSSGCLPFCLDCWSYDPDSEDPFERAERKDRERAAELEAERRAAAEIRAEAAQRVQERAFGRGSVTQSSLAESRSERSESYRHASVTPIVPSYIAESPRSSRSYNRDPGTALRTYREMNLDRETIAVVRQPPRTRQMDRSSR